MTDAGRVSETSCDLILLQYARFLDTVLSDSDDFKSFNPSSENVRLDTFLHSHLAGDKQYGELWLIIKHLLLLSHGQATVERGFSVNRETSVGLVARRPIIDTIRHAGGVLNITISKELLLSASSARSKYNEYLEQKKNEAEATKISMKRKLEEEKVTELKIKRKRFDQEIEYLEKEADRLAEEAELKGQIKFITQSNALRKKAKDKKASLLSLDKEIADEVDRLKANV